MVVAMATGMAMVRTNNNRRLKFGPSRPLRAVICAMVGLALAAAAFAQSASGALFRKNPEIAVQLWPGNGLALEQLASARLLTGVTDPAELSAASDAVMPIAIDAFEHFALSPKAHAIFAFAQQDMEKRDRILSAASALNRRDLLVQGLVLERFVELKKYSAALDAFDRLLRVHPGQQTSFYPILDQAFAEPVTLPEFDRILDGSSVWHDNYLDHVLTNRDLLPNLAKFRLDHRPPNSQFDGQLIAKLTEIGDYGAAKKIHSSLLSKDAPALAAGALGWSAKYPPFDWQFSDERDLRAQGALSGEGIEIYAKSGSGGIVAERVLDTTQRNFRMVIEHDLPTDSDNENVRLRIRCADNAAAVFDEPFESKTARFDIDLSSTSCQTLLLGLYVRAWTGRPAIRGTVRSITLSAQ